jgi:hypothetical protein
MVLTMVSGYWKVKNKHGDKFDKWFNTTLQINCPYVFFADKEMIKIIKKYRKDLPTHYIECSIEDFYSYKYKDKMQVHQRHCPSKELNLIWNEKLFLMQRACEINPFQSNYFMWVDAGICTYRKKIPPKEPFPNKLKLETLPKDKLIYSASTIYDEESVKKSLYYHHISGTYILHKNAINKIINLYKEYMEKLIDNGNIWTDQVLLTHIYKDHKEMFYKLCDGYGTILPFLY